MSTAVEKPRPGRRPVKRDHMVREMRQQILTGRLKPGNRLPTQVELQSQFSTGAFTVQAAIHELQKDGFVHTSRPHGTFVADHPPHLSHFAFISAEAAPEHTSDRQWFRVGLMRAFNELPEQDDRRMKGYYGFKSGTDASDYQRLLDDLDNHRLGGLIFMGPPFALQGTPVLDRPGVPRVGVMTPTAVLPNLPAVYPDYDTFLDIALGLCVRRGWQKLAFLGRGGIDNATDARIEVRATAMGLTIHPHWIQHVVVSHPGDIEPSHRLLSLLMREPSHRPEVLVIEDDSIVPEVTEALKRTGLVAGRDVHVIAHANFPWATESAVPATRIGFNALTFLDRCIDLLKRQRRGETVPNYTPVPAVMPDSLA